MKTHGGDRRSDSLRLVFGCFWMVSSCPSRGFKYCICCGEGTGIRLTSLLDDELLLNWGCIPLPKSAKEYFNMHNKYQNWDKTIKCVKTMEKNEGSKYNP